MVIYPREPLRYSRRMSHRCARSDFCDELAGAAETSFFRTYRGDPESRVLGRTENLAVIADLSPLTSGHILILSKRHHLNFARVVENYPFEITTLLNLLLPQYVQTFGRMTILEHGSAENMVNGACITHAHLHLLPISRQAVDEMMESDGLRWTSFPSLEDFGRPPWTRSAYYLSGAESCFRLYEPTPGLPRQYLRSVAGAILGIPDPEWDWAVVVRKELFRETIARTSNWVFPLTD
ncbi:MAG TPA: HIT domain-containing protein [Pseudonocardiaceae bacterium]|nr:HIT domain-containing protein [Pseudonocardiaceae bacterium]